MKACEKLKNTISKYRQDEIFSSLSIDFDALLITSETKKSSVFQKGSDVFPLGQDKKNVTESNVSSVKLTA